MIKKLGFCFIKLKHVVVHLKFDIRDAFSESAQSIVQFRFIAWVERNVQLVIIDIEVVLDILMSFDDIGNGMSVEGK